MVSRELRNYPAEGLEPRVVLELVIGPAEPDVRSLAHELLHEGYCHLVFEEARELQVFRDDLLVDLERVIRICPKGEAFADELEAADTLDITQSERVTQRPEIYEIVVALALDYFRGHIVRSADDCESPRDLLILRFQELGRPKVYQLNVALRVIEKRMWSYLLIDHDVLGLQVAVDDVHAMQVFDR